MIRLDLGGKRIDTLPLYPKFWPLRVASLPCGILATRFKFLYSSLFFLFFFLQHTRNTTIRKHENCGSTTTLDKGGTTAYIPGIEGGLASLAVLTLADSEA